MRVTNDLKQGFKEIPPWGWGAIGIGGLGVWYIHKRNQANSTSSQAIDPSTGLPMSGVTLGYSQPLSTAAGATGAASVDTTGLEADIQTLGAQLQSSQDQSNALLDQILSGIGGIVANGSSVGNPPTNTIGPIPATGGSAASVGTPTVTNPTPPPNTISPIPTPIVAPPPPPLPIGGGMPIPITSNTPGAATLPGQTFSEGPGGQLILGGSIFSPAPSVPLSGLQPSYYQPPPPPSNIFAGVPQNDANTRPVYLPSAPPGEMGGPPITLTPTPSIGDVLRSIGGMPNIGSVINRQFGDTGVRPATPTGGNPAKPPIIGGISMRRPIPL